MGISKIPGEVVSVDDDDLASFRHEAFQLVRLDGGIGLSGAIEYLQRVVLVKPVAHKLQQGIVTDGLTSV